jgi:predicted NodU family carbamoyl transferase
VPTRIRHVGRFYPIYSLKVRILGISAFYHDSAAALVVDGRAIAAAQEERFTRKKYDAAYPRHAIDYCLRAGGLKLTDIDHVVFYEVMAPYGGIPRATFRPLRAREATAIRYIRASR